jgi:hypothetical protein
MAITEQAIADRPELISGGCDPAWESWRTAAR